ncbi:MAG: restriction endonuclease [Bradyrhizobiaceae bacterium]|nr:restriction endonuclease [Bradyrhizobiaceae bacterium]
MSKRDGTNKLYFGDNLDVLKGMPTASVDLVYLDPPFNSQATYNVLYRSPSGEQSAQYKAFEDTWRWGPAADQAMKHVQQSGSPAFDILVSLNNFMQKSDLMAYLAMMGARLLELRRVLKPSGSLFLHCDAGASHYLKIVLDQIFGAGSFRNEIIWRRSTGKSLMTRRLPTNHDVVLFYAGADAVWNGDEAFAPYDPDALPPKTAAKYVHLDAGRRYRLDSLINPNRNRPNLTYEFLGVTRVWRWTRERMRRAHRDGLIVQTAPGRVPQLKRYLDEQRGLPLDDVWTDIPPINSQAQERLGYPTQKPLALLERIVKLSTKSGDVVLDPFCGCGTAIEASQKLGRNWIGIDVTVLAIDVVEKRLRRMKLKRDRDYAVEGVPLDVDGAHALFDSDPHDFQLWALTLVDGTPRDGGKRGADKGVDGMLYYMDDAATAKRGIVSVKGGKNIHAEHVRELIGSMKNQGADIGLMITLHPPTRAMEQAARDAGSVETFNKVRPAVQIFTVGQLLSGEKPNLPPVLDLIDTAAAARRAFAKKLPKAPTPAEIRESPPLRLVIPGGLASVRQEVLDLDEPLMVQQVERKRPKRARRTA